MSWLERGLVPSILILVAVIHQGLFTLAAALSNQPPQFTNFQGAFFIEEDKPIGTILGVLSAADSDDSELDFFLRGDIANSILELVRVSPTSMNIRLKGPLDREVVDQYTIALEVRDKVNTIQRYSTLYVTDTNDNPPTFQNLPYRAEVSENTPAGATIFTVTATDPDTGVYALVSYNISTNEDLFEIDGTTGAVTLLQSLDYETEKFYQLEVMAQNQGGLNSTTVVIINVKDVQDTAPFFTSLPYMKTLPEDTTVGSSVIQVAALDGDRGVPNPIKYKFISGNTDYFSINPTTGLINVKAVIDREDPKIRDVFGVIDLIVEASEVTTSPTGPTTARAPVTINIQDVNDETPTFSQNFYNASVAENTQARIPITLLPFNTEMVVRDLDQGDNGRFELLLQKDNRPFNAFEVYPGRVLNEASVLIRVKNASAIDYEQVQSFTFEIIAREYKTTQRLQSSASVQVNIQDMNDNWPVFGENAYKGSIPENSALNTPVVQVQATDSDSGVFGKITYFLRGPGASKFRINRDTGEVVVGVRADQDLALLDREKLDTHYMTVEAVDGGGLRSSVQLEVLLTDVNDNPPNVGRTQYEAYVTENNPAFDRPIRIQAVDIDLPPNNIVSYKIIRGNEIGNFRLNNRTGELTLASPLDFEKLPGISNGQITLIIEARDQGTPSMFSFVNCIVYLKDANDESPVFSAPSYPASLPEDSQGGTNVTQVVATDADVTSPNNELIYRIESGARDKFRINAETGHIAVESGADLDRDRYGNQYTLKVLAIDRGTPPQTGTTSVTVTITDINNKKPSFTPTSKTVRVSEGLAVGSEVTGYSAVDADLDANLRYKFLNGFITGEDENKLPVTDLTYLQGLFRIDENNGTVFVASQLDRERVEEVKLIVYVEDLNAVKPPIQTATAELTVVLQDVNDNPPEFVPNDKYSARISEASQPGTEVKQVVAVDNDKTMASIKYYLNYTSDITRSFEITDANRQTGLVTLRNKIDRETHNTVSLLVRAVDSGAKPQTGYATINVDIEDVNDNSPTWVSLDQNVFVSENASTGRFVTQVSAVDEDTGEFSNIRYFITSGDGGKFVMDHVSGRITVAGPLDREVEDRYFLNVEARDNTNASAIQQRITPGFLVVNIQDVNDFSPQFEKTSYMADRVLESVSENTPVITVRAIDLDEGQNSAIVYKIDRTRSNSSDLFEVVPSTGVVYVNKALRGNTGWFLITVIATDRGTPPLSNSTKVNVFISDVNDHKPVFVRPPPNSTLYIQENRPVGTLVTMVRADDEDHGVNGEVRYALVANPTNRNEDWKKFKIDEVSGNITTAQVFDREQQEVFFLEVRAYDRGQPSYDDRETLRLVILDEDDNPPEFDRNKYPVPYRMSVVEEKAGAAVGQVPPATDPDSGSNAVVCYYIIGGDKEYRDKFYLNRTTGVLTLKSALDREVVSQVMLVVKATKDCWSGIWESEAAAWNETDASLLLVKVEVMDVNDSPPVFARKWFTAGVTRDSQLKEPVIDLKEYVFDGDSVPNQEKNFYINGRINITEPLRGQLQKRDQQHPFLLADGVLLTNIYFQPSMQGYFDIPILVDDSTPGHGDAAKVSIYLLNDIQRAKVIVRGDPQEVGKFKDHFAQFLTNITGFVINVDKVETHRDRTGKPDERKVDMFIHAINHSSGEVLDATLLIDLIDKNYISLELLFKKYNVIEIVPAMEVAATSSSGEGLRAILIIIAVILFILLLISCITFFACRKKYKRKLKAATALAFEHSRSRSNVSPRKLNGSAGSGLNHLEMPGTNLHSYEGSNPVWLEYNYENPWPPGEADTESKNSLDENALRSLGRPIDRRPPPPPGQKGPTNSHPYSYMYDEQEVTLEMYNDQYDNYNKPPVSDLDSDRSPSVPRENEEQQNEGGNNTSTPSPELETKAKIESNNQQNINNLSRSSPKLNKASPNPTDGQNGTTDQSPKPSNNPTNGKQAYNNLSFVNDPRFDSLVSTDI